MMTIYEKLMLIKRDIDIVNKDKKNTYANYQYAELSQYFAVVNKQCSDKKCLFTITNINKNPHVQDSKPSYKVNAILMNCEDPYDHIDFEFDVNEDSNTKMSAVQLWGSTTTYLQKYILGIVFEIAYDEYDPDGHDPNDHKPAKPQAKQPQQPPPPPSAPTPQQNLRAYVGRLVKAERITANTFKDKMVKEFNVDAVDKLDSLQTASLQKWLLDNYGACNE